MKDKGFTLVELMIALLIGAMFMAGAMAFFFSYNKETDKRQEQTETRETAIASTHYLVRNLREAGWCTNFKNLSYPKLIEAQQYSIGWAFDGNGDGLYTAADNGGASLHPTANDSLVNHYQLNGLIADRVCYVGFDYLDVNDSLLTQPIVNLDLIYRVIVRVVARSGREFSPPRTYTYPDGTPVTDGFYRYLAEQSVQLRNKSD